MNGTWFGTPLSGLPIYTFTASMDLALVANFVPDVATMAGGFDRAVVHYDARPPTCRDGGPIFLADRMVVTRACRGDINGDCRVGLVKCAAWIGCLGGPQVPYPDGCAPLDLDADGDADMTDYGQLQTLYTGD